MTLTLGGQTIAQLAGNPDECVRVRFKMESFVTETPNHVQVLISNLSLSTRATLMQMAENKAPLMLEAGYVGGSGLIFKGDCWYAIDGRESPTDTVFQLFARDGGQAYDYTTISKTLSAGSTPKDHWNTLISAMSKYGISIGQTPDLSSPTYPRAVSFYGQVRDFVRTLASSNRSTWSIQNGVAQMQLANGTPVAGAPYDLNSGSGLIGMPTQTPGGILARCLINPALNCGHGSNQVHIDQKDIQRAILSASLPANPSNNALPALLADGIYTIVHIDITGDTRGNDWYQDLTCVDPKNPGLGLGPNLTSLN